MVPNPLLNQDATLLEIVHMASGLGNSDRPKPDKERLLKLSLFF